MWVKHANLVLSLSLKIYHIFGEIFHVRRIKTTREISMGIFLAKIDRKLIVSTSISFFELEHGKLIGYL